MKKTLVALAVLAVSGAAFAQSSVALTGKLRFAYGDQKAADGAKTTGGVMTDGDWNIAAVEDLGGGLRAGANMALRLRGRDTAIDGTYAIDTTKNTATANGARPRDSSLFLAGGFGTITVGAVEAGNGILGLVTAGGPTYIGLDNNAQLAGASNVDLLGYTSPNMSGFTFRVQSVDNVGGGGAQSTATTQDAMILGATYAAGPLSANVDLTNYGANKATGTLADSRTRLSANYDLGVARIGAGQQSMKYVGGAKKTETAVSVSAPFGPVLVGAIYATSKTTGVAGNNTGYDLAVQYNLSRRTYVALQSQSTKAAGASASATNTRVQLAHSF